MGLFSFGKKDSVLGIDLGTSSVKAVELSLVEDKPTLTNYGWVYFGEEQTKSTNSALVHTDRIKDYLRALIKDMKSETRRSYISLPGYSGLITMVEFPAMDEKELDSAVRFEAHKYVPTSLDEVALSWEVVGTSGGQVAGSEETIAGQGMLKILLVAAPKDDVSRYEEVLTASGLDMEALEIETFSLVRSLVGKKDGTHIIVDIGARATNIILVESGIIHANRNVDIGGNEITESLAGSLKITPDRAERFKKEKTILGNTQTSIILPTIELLKGEIERIIGSYSKKNPGKKVSSIVLSGGTGKLRGLDTFLSQQFGVETVKGDPWAQISYPDSLSSVVDSIGPSFAVVNGLALRGIEELRPKKK